MAALEAQRRRLQAVGRLKSVVHAMRALAAATLRQYERVVAAQVEFERTLERGLQALLLSPGRARWRIVPAASQEAFNVVLFGSDRGMCGRFNDDVVAQLAGLPARPASALVVGLRAAERLAAAGLRPREVLSLPASPAGLTGLIELLLEQIERCQTETSAGRLLIILNQPDGLRARPAVRQLLPVDPDWLRALRRRPWPTRVIPCAGPDRPALMRALLRRATWAALYRAAAESQMAENLSRLQAMQSAEKHVDDHLAELEISYCRHRQDAITEEVMDVLVGSEALQSGQPPD